MGRQSWKKSWHDGVDKYDYNWDRFFLLGGYFKVNPYRLI